MKFIAQVIVILIVSYLAALYLPWYSVAVVAFVFGYLLKSTANFLAGFLAIGLLGFIKVWMTTSASPSDLAERVSHIFPVQKELWLIVLTVVIGVRSA